MGFLPDFLSDLPVVGGAFGNSSDQQNAENNYRANQNLWNDVYNHYTGPDGSWQDTPNPAYDSTIAGLPSFMRGAAAGVIPKTTKTWVADPNYARMMGSLSDEADTGFDAAGKAALLSTLSQVGQQEKGQQDAALQRSQMMGGGTSMQGGQLAALQQAGQMGNVAAQGAGVGIAGQAQNRRAASRSMYMQTKAQNAESQNLYRLHAASGLTGANTQMGNYYGANDAAKKSQIQHYTDAAVSAFAGAPPTGASGGGSVPQIPNSPLASNTYPDDSTYSQRMGWN